MSPGLVLAAAAPVLLLLICILGFKINTVVSGVIAVCVSILISLFIFGGNFRLLLIAAGKGLSLALFVLLIVWTSLFLYNLMKSLGLLQVVADSITKIRIGRLGLALLLGWTFAGFMEGIAGFGVPAAVLAPLMIAVGFTPLTAVVAVLVGHSWAVTFGGMAGAYYTIQLATGLPAGPLGSLMGWLFTLPIIVAGLMVCHIEGGWAGLRQAIPSVLLAGLVMASVVWLMIFWNSAQIAAVAAGLAGSLSLWLLSRIHLLPGSDDNRHSVATRTGAKYSSFHVAFLPYYILIFLALISQLPFIKQATAHLYLAVSYPGGQTASGYLVPPAPDYAKILLVGHPAPIILVSILVTLRVFYGRSKSSGGVILKTFKATLLQCWQPSLAIIAVVVMALIMNDSGMTNKIAVTLADFSGGFYPFLSPFVGVLGTFMTGSNASSNVMFGVLQTGAATALGISPLVIAASQTIGGSLGAAIAPAKVLLGSSACGLGGQESAILKKTLVYCLIAAFMVGLEVFLVVKLAGFG